jgi:hypothetical protein
LSYLFPSARRQTQARSVLIRECKKSHDEN